MCPHGDESHAMQHNNKWAGLERFFQTQAVTRRRIVTRAGVPFIFEKSSRLEKAHARERKCSFRATCNGVGAVLVCRRHCHVRTCVVDRTAKCSRQNMSVCLLVLPRPPHTHAVSANHACSRLLQLQSECRGGHGWGLIGLPLVYH